MNISFQWYNSNEIISFCKKEWGKIMYVLIKKLQDIFVEWMNISMLEWYAQCNVWIDLPIQQILLSICYVSGITLNTWYVSIANQTKISTVGELTFC